MKFRGQTRSRAGHRGNNSKKSFRTFFVGLCFYASFHHLILRYWTNCFMQPSTKLGFRGEHLEKHTETHTERLEPTVFSAWDEMETLPFLLKMVFGANEMGLVIRPKIVCSNSLVKCPGAGICFAQVSGFNAECSLVPLINAVLASANAKLSLLPEVYSTTVFNTTIHLLSCLQLEKQCHRLQDRLRKMRS